MARKRRIDSLAPGDVFCDGSGTRYYVYIGPASLFDKDCVEAFDLQDNYVDHSWLAETKVEKVKAKIVVEHD